MRQHHGEPVYTNAYQRIIRRGLVRWFEKQRKNKEYARFNRVLQEVHEQLPGERGLNKAAFSLCFEGGCVGLSYFLVCGHGPFTAKW